MTAQSSNSNSYLQYFSDADNFIQSAYYQLLHRTADANGLAFWTAQIKNGTTYANVIKNIINSHEYSASITNPSDFVSSLYTNLLHRTPENEAINYWSQQLAINSKEFVVKCILQSKEFQTDAANQGLTATSGPLLLSSEGGGLRAMTSDAGLIAGLLKSYQDTRGTQINISTILSHVDAISSNSGSSWFISALAYSAPFETSLQNYSQLFDPNNGYMGLMGKAYIQYLNPSNNEASNNFSIISDLMIKLPNLNWAEFLDQTVYAPYNTSNQLQGINLHSSIGQRTAALPNQALIFEASISADQAAIAPYTPIGEMVASVTNAGVDSSGKAFEFIPTAFTSISSKSTQVATILPTIKSGALNLTYTDLLNISQSNPPTSNAVAPNLNFDGLSVFTASAASSAALAVENSKGASGSSPLTLKLTQELATPVQINASSAVSVGTDYPNAAGKDYPVVGALSLNAVSSNPVIRLGDGHYADGTSVTAGMSYFTPDQLKNGFSITLFGNMGYNEFMKSKMPDASILSILGIGQDPSSLLNVNAEASVLGGTTNLNHPSNKIFDLINVPDPLNWKPTPIWSHSVPSDKFVINYYEIAVKTAEGNSYTTAGNTGIVRLWEVATDTGMITAPTEKGWSAYSQLYNDIITSLQVQDNGNLGATLLAHSLGLV